jgi:starch synthase
MDQQKGIDLAFSALRSNLDVPWQAVILGSGDPALEESARSFETEFPQRIRAKITFDSALSHRMYAGSDMLLMPSRYEPCGLSQMIAMRYGTIPVARATGGLKDTIIDATQNISGNGFLFENADAVQTARTLRTAIETFRKKNRWRELMVNAMKSDFSWRESAIKYISLYQELIKT